jgi:prephenate dehydrogenase
VSLSSSAPAVLVVGAGLVGASIGCALRAASVPVYLRDAKLSHAVVAAELGAGSVAKPDPEELGLVVAAVPPRALPEVIGDALTSYPAATVTDVGSVKAGVLGALWDSGTDLSRYVGSHPMAGSQHSGPMTARADLFVDRTWAITPHRRSAAGSVAAVVSMATTCGARPVIMDVDDHDAAVARVSHLPHLMAVLMASHLTSVPSDDLLLAGQGLRDVTRVAGSDPELWEQILRANASAVLAELDSVRGRLTELVRALESPSDGDLHAHLAHAVEGTRRIPGKHGTPLVEYTEIVVEIPDAPGALGRLFALVGDAGVNVEDISIEHDQVRQVGYLALAVSPGQAPALREAISREGWTVQA